MNILGMGPMELLLIVVLALIVFGPAKLPEIMGQVGKAINDFRRATSELSDEFNRTIQAELQETKAVIEDTKSVVSDMHASVNSAVSGLPAPTRTAEPVQTLPPPAPAVATNGISSEPHPEAFTNGTVPPQVQPPLVDTTQWSWETSGPKPPDAESPSPAAATEPRPAAPADTADPLDSVTPASPAPPASGSAQERTKQDDLLPPY